MLLNMREREIAHIIIIEIDKRKEQPTAIDDNQKNIWATVFLIQINQFSDCYLWFSLTIDKQHK